MKTTSKRAFRPNRLISSVKFSHFWTTWTFPEELRALSSWKVHTLTGDRKGAWSLSVTANRRLTFCVDTVLNAAANREIYEVNLEDYH